MNSLNAYFDNIFVINLQDKIERRNKVASQFEQHDIRYEKFVAIDGRVDNYREGISKRDTFEKLYDCFIPITEDNYKEILCATSLVLNNLAIYRYMIRENIKRVLICEDDVVLPDTLCSDFESSIDQLNTIDWDVLYLGSGNDSGVEGLSWEQTNQAYFLSPFAEIYGDYYVAHPCDSRVMGGKSTKITDTFSIPFKAGGTWCYAVTLRGAKHILDYIGKRVGWHIDHLINDACNIARLNVIAYDPPIAYHNDPYARKDTSIPWKW
jgi:GR25 family glycosyltransferase involved in LPS biosynthesis